AGAVEFAIVGSLLIVLLLGVIQLGWALQMRNELGKAADHAVRYVLLDPDADDEEFEQQATDYAALHGYDEDRLSVEAGETTVGDTDFRTLSVEYDMPLSIPGFPVSLVTLGVSRRTPDF
ncbi:MAG: pilus assembly protein, partial [Pseudomonadota bacterium]|nr:pilus assembly protein [Pseudomonadota bacterium]